MMQDDGVREESGVSREGKAYVSLRECGRGVAIDMDFSSRRHVTLAEAKTLRRCLSRLIRRIESREILP